MKVTKQAEQKQERKKGESRGKKETIIKKEVWRERGGKEGKTSRIHSQL